MDILCQKVNGVLNYIDLGSLGTTLSNKLFHPSLYPKPIKHYIQQDTTPITLKLPKPDSVLEITSFLFFNTESNTEIEYPLAPEDEYFHVFQLPLFTKKGIFSFKYGFKDIMGNKGWREETITVA